MGKRGPKPKGKIEIKWSANFAYAIGLIVADGSLSKDGYHIDFTSKEIEQIYNFIKCLSIVGNKIGVKKSGTDGKSFRIQFGDVFFYNFLKSIGLTPNKSKTINGVMIPAKYYADFLRGEFDGDGSIYSYYDSRWRSSHMFYTIFGSGSKNFISWLQKNNKKYFGVVGHVDEVRKTDFFQLKYAKKESIILYEKMYYKPGIPCLNRKKLKIEKILKVEKKQQKRYSTI